jgi:hypothetical protein
VQSKRHCVDGQAGTSNKNRLKVSWNLALIWNALMNNALDDFSRKMGTILIILGVCVWGVYAVLRYVLDVDVSSRDFLTFHLAGVVPGALLRRHQSICRFYGRYVKKA